jgi:CRISPR-associated protein Cas2
MAATENWYLLCYDIADKRRLQRVHRCMKDAGISLQYSVFLLNMSSVDLILLLDDLRELIEEGSDDVRAYPISPAIEYVALGRQGLGNGMLLTAEGLIRLESQDEVVDETA